MRNRPLIEAAVRLRGTAPSLWDAFLDALEREAAHCADECVAAPIETLQRAQGRAQLARDLIRELRSAPATYDKLRGKP